MAIAFAREGADAALSYLPVEENLTLNALLGLSAMTDSQPSACPATFPTPPRHENWWQMPFEDTFRTNAFAMVWTTKAALPHLAPGSTIINTTPVQAYNPSPTRIDHASTKAAINNVSKGLAQQLAPLGIRVNAVASGPIWTPLQVSDGQPKEKRPDLGKNTPLGLAGQPTELVSAYVFLASSESSCITGETLNVYAGAPSP